MIDLKDHVLGRIRGGVLKPGDRLPTERELAEQYGSTRAAVRKIMEELEREGHIQRTVRRGTFVAEARSSFRDADPMTIAQLSPAEVTRARLLFEPNVAALAAINATPQDLKKMTDCVERSEAAESVPEFDYWDGAFHLAIADATRNNFIRLICNHVQQVRTHAEWGRLKYLSVTPERRVGYQRDHRQILDALLARDGEGARQQAEHHLRNVVRNLFAEDNL